MYAKPELRREQITTNLKGFSILLPPLAIDVEVERLCGEPEEDPAMPLVPMPAILCL